MSTDDSASFSLSNVLTPGSSLHPTLLLFLDVCFGALLGVLGTLLVLTRGNIHFIFLIFIELCLWASVKWCVCLALNADRALLTWFTGSSQSSGALPLSQQTLRLALRTRIK